MSSVPALDLAAALNDALPQTQCTRCGYPDCRSYAEAISTEGAPINRCPPGGHEGIVRLSVLTGRSVLPLDPDCGSEAPRQLAVIDEAACIGCTLCLAACPVDCIIGGPKRMHTVIDAECTGCELCLPVCPVDCISLETVSADRTGWQAWTQAQAQHARERHDWHRQRLERDAAERGAAHSNAAQPSDRRSMVDAAISQARVLRDARSASH